MKPWKLAVLALFVLAPLAAAAEHEPAADLDELLSVRVSEAARARFMRGTAALGALVFLVGLAAAWAIGSVVMRPLRQMVATARRIGSGHLDLRAPERRLHPGGERAGAGDDGRHPAPLLLASARGGDRSRGRSRAPERLRDRAGGRGRGRDGGEKRVKHL